MNRILFFLLLLLAIEACKSSKESQSNSDQPADEKVETVSPLYDSWGLLELNGQRIDLSKLSRSPMMDINTNEKKMMASTGCNSFTTGFDYDDKGYFKVHTPFAITEMACPGYSIEREFLMALEKITSYERKGVDLYFMNGEEVLFHYRKVD